MFNRFIMSVYGDPARPADTAVISSRSPAFGSARSVIKTAHHTLTIVGVVAIGALGTLVVNPDFTDHIKEFSPFSTAQVSQDRITNFAQAIPVVIASATPTVGASVAQAESPSEKTLQAPARLNAAKDTAADHLNLTTGADKSRAAASPREQQWVTNWLAKRYRVASDATHMLVSAAYQNAKDSKLDPLLILSVMAIESGFNPFAESPVGAQGLMQVMSKIHHDKFQPLGGVKVALNPVANIKVGTQILKEYVNRGGSVEAGLKMYVGAAAFENDAGYGSKVLAEYRRLKDVASGKTVPVVTSAPVVAQKPRPAEPAIEKTRVAPAEPETTPPASPNIATVSPDRMAAL